MQNTIVSFSAVSLMILALSGCNSSQSDDLSRYTGNTNPATLSSAAIANVFIDSYSAANYSLSASDLTGTRNLTASRSTQTRTTTPRTALPVNDTYYGQCGGYLDYNGTYDNQTTILTFWPLHRITAITTKFTMATYPFKATVTT